MLLLQEWINRLLPVIALSVLTVNQANGQCQLSANASNTSITCGDCVTLSAFGSGSGNVAFEEDFNSGVPSGWQFTQSARFDNPCSPGGVDGTTHMWMGDASPNPRDMVTQSLDLTLGGSICFDMLFATQGNASPCEGPDEPDEGVYLQYSTDGGTTWVTIHYFDPNGGNDPQLTNWNNWCFALPAGALTANTLIRWHQDDVTDDVYDHWGIDNVVITLNDPNFEITWLHDNYSYGLGNGGGNNPTQVCPTTTTTYTAQITNGTVTCTESVTVTVNDPTIIINAGQDQSICPGDCVTLNGEAYELVSPASTPTFENNEFSLVASGNASVNINIQGLNTTSLVNGSITEICVNGFSFSGSSICTNFGGCPCNGSTISIGQTCNINSSAFEVTLTAPGGCSITLVPAGVANGNYGTVCFVPAGGSALTPGFQNGGTYAPSDPISGLNGCNPNGVWTLEFSAPGLGIGIGTLNGWSISFDDPEITAPVNFSWSPTTNMTGSGTLTPTVCPTNTTTYTLTATDQDNCLTVTDDVVVTVLNNCCALTIDNVAQNNPGCGTNNGSITITVSGQTTGLQYSIDNGATFQTSNTFTNLPAGTYDILVNDDNNCPVTQQVTLSSPGGPAITTVQTTDPDCGSSNGSITINATGATQYSIDNGLSFQASNTFNNLPAGNYTIVVSDGACDATSSATLTAATGPNISGVQTTDPDCGLSNGSITINANGATQYSIDNGVTFQASNVFSNLSAGNYSILVTDGSCDATSSATLTPGNAPVINGTTSTDADCGISNGTITINATGATQYSIDNGVTFQASNVFNNLPAGNYQIVVSDGNCTSTSTVSISSTSAPVINAINITDADCGVNNGSIQIDATGAAQYSIDNGLTFQTGNSFSNLGAGNYSIVVDDGSGCVANSSVTINASGGPTFDTASSTDPTCGINDGEIQITATGANQYSIDNGVTFQASPIFSGLAPGTYTIVVSDGSCTDNSQVTLTALPGPSIDNINATDDNCGSGSGSIVITATGASQYSIDNGATFQANSTFTGLSAGTYNVVVDNGNGCTDIDVITVGNSGSITITGVVANSASCGQNNGSISVTAPGANQYSIDNGATFQVSGVFSNLGPGTYQIIAQLNASCIADTTVQLNSLPGPTISGVSSSDILCFGDNSGSITVTSSTAFEFSIDGGNNFQTGGQFNNLSAGTYTVIAVDAGGCQVDTTLVLSQPQELTIDLNSINATCNSLCNGSAVVLAQGGTVTTGYVYNWSSSIAANNSAQAQNICAGSYNVTVLDDNGCSADTSFIITEPIPLVVSGITPTDETCPGSCDGTITLDASWAIQIEVNGVVSTNPVNNLCPGNYGIELTDANGCAIDVLTTILPGNPVTADFEFTPDSASQLNPDFEFINLSNGATQYLWDFGDGNSSTEINPSHSYLSDPGDYTVCLTAINNLGCFDQHCEEVTVYPELFIYVPNAFTPNNSGENDTFFAVGDPSLNVNFTLLIFDRWGELIFESNDINEGWNGTHKGRDCPIGVYVWKIKVQVPNSLEVKTLIGHVTLVR